MIETWVISLITWIVLILILIPLGMALGYAIVELIKELIKSGKDGKIDDDELERIKAKMNVVGRRFFALLGVFGIRINTKIFEN